MSLRETRYASATKNFLAAIFSFSYSQFLFYNERLDIMLPSQIATSPNVASMVVPPYDFETQSRNGIMAMSFTGNSVQTFDYAGKPNDAKNDNND